MQAPTTPPLRGTPPRAGGERSFSPRLFKAGWREAPGWLLKAMMLTPPSTYPVPPVMRRT